MAHSLRHTPADNAGMLKWTLRTQYETLPTSLMLDGRVVAMMLERVDGTWLARLDAHQPIPAPIVARRCTSFEAGKRGCEQWATRHADRLRNELAGTGLVTRGAG